MRLLPIRQRLRITVSALAALALIAFATVTPAPLSAQVSNDGATNLSALAEAAGNVTAPVDNGVTEAPPLDQTVRAGAPDAGSNGSALPADPRPSAGDPWGWLKVIVAGLVGAAGVLATQWITARTSREIAGMQAEISRSAVLVAADAAKASALGASAAVESAGAARESAAVAGRNADNIGVHAVARLRQEWINTVRDELSKLHSLLANYRPLPPKPTVAQTAAHEQRLRDANQCKAKVALLLNPREIPSRNLSVVIRHLEAPNLPVGERARWSRWIVRWGQILLKEEWDRVRAELKGEARAAPYRRKRKWQQ